MKIKQNLILIMVLHSARESEIFKDTSLQISANSSKNACSMACIKHCTFCYYITAPDISDPKNIYYNQYHRCVLHHFNFKRHGHCNTGYESKLLSISWQISTKVLDSVTGKNPSQRAV